MTKKRRKDQPEVSEEVQPRRHRRLRQKEAETERRVIIGVGAAIGLVVVLLLAGVVNQFVVQPRQPIAKVNQDAISVAAFQRRLRFSQDNLVNQINQYIAFGQQFASNGQNPFQQIIQQLFDSLSTPERYSLTVLDNMIEEDLVRQLAAEYDVEVTDEEVQREIEQQFGYDRDAEPTPTPDASKPVTDTVSGPTSITPEEFQTQYNERMATMRDRDSLTEAEFRQLIAVSLLRDKLKEVAPLEFERTEEQVHARHILVRANPEPVDPTKAEADALKKIQDAKARIEAGESFEEVATEVSDDTGSAAQGGDLGWFGRGAMVPEFEEAAFALEPGEMSDPIKTQFGYHLILVEDKDEEKDQVKARHILARLDLTPPADAQEAADEEALAKIEAARERILNGESFADVAKEISEDTSNAEEGGDLGWFGRGVMAPEFEDVAFSLEPGQVSEPVKTQFGYHLILVEEHDAEHEVDETELANRRDAAFTEWLQAQQDAAAIERNWSLDYVPNLPNDLTDTINQLRRVILAGAQPQQPTPEATPMGDHSQ